MDSKLKYKIVSLLQQPDLTARMISEELDVTYAAVLRVEKEYAQAKLNNTVASLFGEALTGDVLPAAAGTLGVETEELVKSLKGLDKLSVDLQETASQLNTRVRTLVMSAEHLSELLIASTIICDINKAFVNTDKTQVNVQNNFGGQDNASSRYAGYLKDTPVA